MDWNKLFAFRFSRRHAMEADLNLFNLLDTTYCLLRAYLVWIYARLVKVTKIDRLLSSFRLFIGNVKASEY